MSKGELELIRWLERSVVTGGASQSDGPHTRVPIPVGDDMGCLTLPGGQSILLGSDMLVDGTHFECGTHNLADIAHKAVCCCLSDAAAMAVQPLAALVSLAIPRGMVYETGRALLEAMIAVAGRFDCTIIGGDTTSWEGRLAIDVALLAVPWPDCPPITRRGARPGDRLFITGKLGGSRLGRHLSFVPRISEARSLAKALGPELHAMIDISDGLALDLHRLCQASGCGAVIREASLEAVISPDAHEAARQDGRSALEHALSDGEDFELLFAVAKDAVPKLAALNVDQHEIGEIVPEAVQLQSPDGGLSVLSAEGYEH
ncbi:MAG: thiamine-monophosphate kinase [Planctomycetes bacterium]|nr:thiamine-monophosphate kinase [Planctomycetota bacterium]